MEEFGQTILTWITETGIKLLIAVILVIVAFKVIDKIASALKKKNDETKKIDATFFRTIVTVCSVLLKILIVVCMISYVGIDTSAVTAFIASLGVAGGLAVNGALSNIAGGILLLFTRPFKEGDYIECSGSGGIVEEISLCNTKIVTLDNKVVYIPNGTAANAVVTNFSEKELRRVDLTYTIPYTEDFEKAKEVMLKVAEAEPLVVADPAPFARMTDQGKNGFEIQSRTYCKASDYWDTYFNMLENTKKALADAGFTAPHDQVDLHTKKD